MKKLVGIVFLSSLLGGCAGTTTAIDPETGDLLVTNTETGSTVRLPAEGGLSGVEVGGAAAGGMGLLGVGAWAARRFLGVQIQQGTPGPPAA